MTFLLLLLGCDLWVDTVCSPEIHRADLGYVDADGDGIGGETPICDGSGAKEGGDCDDDDPAYQVEQTWYLDGDTDGYGGMEEVSECGPPDGYVPRPGDCADDNDLFGARCPWVSVSSGVLHTCGLRSDGSVACWGTNSHGQLDVPEALASGEATASVVSAGGYHTCAIVEPEGTLRCWGRFDLKGGEVPYPGGETGFTEVVSGITHACGVQNGAVVCWGVEGGPLAKPATQATPPADAPPLSGLTAGFYHTCGLDASGTAYCWGYMGDRFGVKNESSQVRPPTTTFTSLSAGGFHTCGVGQDGAVSCWGNEEFGQSEDRSGPFTAVSAGGYHTCAVGTDGVVTCWGRPDQGQCTPPAEHAEEKLSAVAAGAYHTCGLLADSSEIVCWGDDSWHQDRPPAFAAVAAGGNLTVAARPDGLSAWGDRGEPPFLDWSRDFDSVAAGSGHVCALESGRPVCWGFGVDGQTSPPPDLVDLVDVSTGNSYPSTESFTCGLTEGGEISCWGGNSYGQLDVPAGAYSAVSAGGYHACAVEANSGAVRCWGADYVNAEVEADPLGVDWGQTDVPEDLGPVLEVSAGGRLTCARVGTNPDLPGRVRCWGKVDYDSEESGVEYVEVSAGYDHACGLRAENDPIDCWGSYTSTESGSYVAVSSGFRHSCGVTKLGTVACFGNEFGYGEHTVPAELTDGDESAVVDGISAGGLFTCAHTVEDDVVCWGANLYGQLEVPTDPVSPEVSVGPAFACAVDQGAIVCADADAMGEPPAGRVFEAVVVGRAHGCGLDSEGYVNCWGDDEEDQVSGAPEGSGYTRIAAAGDHTCALAADGTVQCFGDGWDADALDGTYTEIATGLDHVCALNAAGGVLCAGDDTWGQSDEPEHDLAFVSLAAGDWHTCALDEAGAAHCWGLDTYGQVSDAPTWAFEKLAAGAEHTCGLKPDGFVECWGRDLEGQASPLAP